MHPQVGPLAGFVVGWLLAAVLGGGSAVWLLYRSGLTDYQIAVALYSRVAALLIGSKILYLIEAWPAWTADRAAIMAALFSEQMRIPGGILLALAIGPWVARASGVRYLALADTIVPAAGLMILGIRTGCFLEGCCFGTPSTVPWAVRFPAMSEVYAWQQQHGLLSAGLPESLSVHPLQLYFGLAGLLLFAGLAAYQPYKRYEGEILLLFALGFLWSTWLLETMRARPHVLTQHIVLGAAVATTTLTAAIEISRRVRRSTAARITAE
jgi:phosphatidylglycerol:prolipoprotein diacylglycerol transferase